MKILLALIAFAFFTASQAQNYPLKPIRLVVPFAPGSSIVAAANYVPRRVEIASPQQMVRLVPSPRGI
jgi:tripartite-type tricarboxylate transporter receptor subunit TctC